MNFGDMTSYVQRRLIDPNATAVSVADVQQAINDAINFTKDQRFYFNEVLDTATLTAHSPDFPYPSDFLMPVGDDDGFYVQYGQIRYPLNKITRQQGDAIWIANGYGLPRWFYRNGMTYQCYPMPDQNYTVGRHYLKDYPDLVATTDTNDFTDYAYRPICLWATANLLDELRQDNTNADRLRSNASAEFGSLIKQTNKMNGSGKVTNHSLL